MECWRCRYPFEAHAPVGELRQADPVEGDVSLCWQCGAVGIFRLVDGALVIEPPTPEEVSEIVLAPPMVEAAAMFELRRKEAGR